MKIRLHEPTFGEQEIAAAVDVLRSTMVTQGTKVREFERAYWPHGKAVACNSGSSANLLAISALKSAGVLNDGDEVIVSALSWSTTVWPLIQHNLVPVLVDCDLETLNIDPNEVERAITRETRAIMPVHVYGNPCDMDHLAGFNRPIIEDACEAMGAEYDGRPIGSFGVVGTFSFYFSHHLTTLEGGVCVTGGSEFADVMRIQRSHGWTRDVEDADFYAKANPDIDPRFLFVDLGYNVRMTEVQAAIGLCQLPKLGAIVNARRTAHAAYRKALAGFDFLRPQIEQPGGKSSCFGFNVILDGVDRNEMAAFLNARGIETRPIIAGNLARHPGMKRYPHRVVGNLSNANRVMDCGLSIGCHQDIGPDQVAYVAEAVEEFSCGR